MVHIFAATSPDNNPGIGPVSVVINSLWILFALVMLGVAFFFFRKWDRRAKFSSLDSTAPPPAPGTVNMQMPPEMLPGAMNAPTTERGAIDNERTRGEMRNR